MRACRRAGLRVPGGPRRRRRRAARHGRARDGATCRARRSPAGSCATTSSRERTRAPRRRPRPVPRRACTPSTRPRCRALRRRSARAVWDTYLAIDDAARRSSRATSGWSPTGPPRTGDDDRARRPAARQPHRRRPTASRPSIDWELVHVGDPLEDLAWLCVKAWRFGAPLEVGGLGTIDQLVAAYEGAGGRPVDRDALHWWLVAKTLTWGIGCMGQADVPPLRRGALASSSPRSAGGSAEQEWDLIELLAPDACRGRARRAPTRGPRRRRAPVRPPDGARAARRRARTTSPTRSCRRRRRLAYHARVAANMLGDRRARARATARPATTATTGRRSLPRCATNSSSRTRSTLTAGRVPDRSHRRVNREPR